MLMVKIKIFEQERSSQEQVKEKQMMICKKCSTADGD
jgi:hypothetical protein